MMFAYPGRGEGGQRLLPFLGGTIPASEFVIQSIGFFLLFFQLCLSLNHDGIGILKRIDEMNVKETGLMTF